MNAKQLLDYYSGVELPLTLTFKNKKIHLLDREGDDFFILDSKSREFYISKINLVNSLIKEAKENEEVIFILEDGNKKSFEDLFDFIEKTPKKNIRFYELYNGEIKVGKERLTIHKGSIYKFASGSTKKGMPFSTNGINKIIARLNNDFGISEEGLKQFEYYKKIEKFANLEYHPNVLRKDFSDLIPKSYEERINDKIEDTNWKTKEKYWRLKDLYDYKATSGCELDGKVIGEQRLRTLFGLNYDRFLEALEKGEKYHTFTSENYDYKLSCEPSQVEGKVRLFLSEEYKGTGNGHYYISTDGKNFIYVEKD